MDKKKNIKFNDSKYNDHATYQLDNMDRNEIKLKKSGEKLSKKVKPNMNQQLDSSFRPESERVLSIARPSIKQKKLVNLGNSGPVVKISTSRRTVDVRLSRNQSKKAAD